MPVTLEILSEAGEQPANPYVYIPVCHAKHPQAKPVVAAETAQRLTSAKVQALIVCYSLHGKPLFFGDAK